MNKFQNIFCILAVLAIGMLGTGCSTEDSQVEVPEPKGILCLNMSSDEVYVQAGTRAVQTLTDWSGFQFTLDNGTASMPLVFTDGKAVIEAGTYTLSATNAASVDNGYSGPLYSGSESVTIEAGKQTDVTLDLGKPKNAKVTLALSEAFSAKYDLSSMTLTDGSVTSSMTPSNTTAYFPASVTQLTYTLVADAKSGSHVQDITSAKGTITISAGTHTPIILKINPIDDSLVMIETGTEYDGVFQQLIDVARASIKELKEDYEDYLTTRNLCKWDDQHPRFAPMLDFCRQHNNQADYSSMYYKASDEELANLALTLCRQVDKMMTTYLEQLEKTFIEEGGIKERMTAARLGRRQTQNETIEAQAHEIEQLKERIKQLGEELMRYKSQG